MRHQWLIIWILASMLGTAFMGCSSKHCYDRRLTVADSLMQKNPDSALTIIEAVCYDSLASQGDRAYYDLLLTQVNYKCYITATSDSNINRALAYFLGHKGEREKLTRSYIYKGAVMEELGHPDSAMIYYKHAESTAADDDCFNLGYCKMRIATLYQGQVSQDSAAIIRLKEAIHYFEELRDTSYLISCYGSLGAICGVTYPDSTEYYLSTAISLAQSYKPEKQYTYLSKLAGFCYLYKKDYQRAKELAMRVLNEGKDKSKESQFYTYAALAYVKLGLIDSAKLVLQMTPAPVDRVDSMGRYDVLTEIERAEKNHLNMPANVDSKSYSIANQILADSKEKELIKVEAAHEQQRADNDKVKLNKRNKTLAIGLGVAFLLLLLLVGVIYHLQRMVANDRSEIALTKNELINQIEELKQRLNENDITVSQLVRYRISALNELFQEIKVKTRDESKVRRIVPLSSLLKSMNERHEIMNIKPSNSFWEKMKRSVDGEFNGIASYVEKQYPGLSDQELKLFYMLCAGISPQIIKLCLNYTNAVTVSNYKRKLVKERFGLDMKFEDFIQRYMNNDL